MEGGLHTTSTNQLIMENLLRDAKKRLDAIASNSKTWAEFNTTASKDAKLLSVLGRRMLKAAIQRNEIGITLP